MSFPKAPLKRFNEAPTCAPPPGSYDIQTSDSSKGPVSFDKSHRFRMETEDVGTQQNPSSMKPPSPATRRKLQSLGSRPNSLGLKSEKDLTVMKGLRKQKELEKEIRVLIAERGQQDKKLQGLEEDLAKSESKLCAVIREKTSLLTNVASLEKQLLELSRSNEILKTKYFEDGTQKMSRLYTELMRLRNRMNTKKTAFVKQENMDTKLNTDQRTLDHSNEKATQLEEQPTAAERQDEEKCDSEKLLEYIAELGNVAEQVEDKFKMDIAQLEEKIEAKNKETETLQSTLQLKESTLSAQIEELREKCKMYEQQKGKCLIEYGEKEQTLNAEIEHLKEKLDLEEREHQKQKEVCKASATTHQKLLEFQEEVAKEREILNRELKETMDELDRLHTKEGKVDKLLKHLEEENKAQAEELAQLEGKLKRKNAKLEKMAELHSSAIVKMQEEHSNTLCKLGETVAEFETMLLDAETKIALRDAEIKKIKDSNIVQIANLQARLEDQSEELNKQLEMERKTIAEKLEADYIKSINNWRVLYEDLYNKVKPFQQQLDAYEAEKNALLNEHGVAQEELNKISDAYAKLLGHQNQKQKIKHVMKLKEENTQLKQEVSRLRTQLAKNKQVHGELQGQINEIQGIKRFDPSKAFQHSTKENVAPKTPFKESNRNKSQAALY
ncbi:hyaluronan mediated motility receptor isoform X2 [Elgaria multicarinata webbii]|uniref:hyaluronan mediated motility receptor isoform X2 n=1 Tax=Elgaria multicarinata webbii TaxID=159646 RepID=UPI002FCCD8E5